MFKGFMSALAIPSVLLVTACQAGAWRPGATPVGAAVAEILETRRRPVLDDELGPWTELLRKVRTRGRCADRDEPVRLGESERVEQHGVDDGEDGRAAGCGCYNV